MAKVHQLCSAMDFAHASRQPMTPPLAETISASKYRTAIYLTESVSDALTARIEQLAAVALTCTQADYFNDKASEALRNLAFDLAGQVLALRTVEQDGIAFPFGGAQP